MHILESRNELGDEKQEEENKMEINELKKQK